MDKEKKSVLNDGVTWKWYLMAIVVSIAIAFLSIYFESDIIEFFKGKTLEFNISCEKPVNNETRLFNANFTTSEKQFYGGNAAECMTYTDGNSYCISYGHGVLPTLNDDSWVCETKRI